MAAQVLAVVIMAFGGIEPPAVETRTAWVEINHLVDVTPGDDGKPKTRIILSQVIFWDSPGREECVAWRLLDKVDGIREDQRGVTITWTDGDTLRRVRAGFLIETATMIDPEVRARELVRSELRRGLGGACEGRIYPSLRIMRMKETRQGD